ncbi:phosphopyruvate hydratase [Candidatus Berkelbacteria bacterium]|nr:phosphopyruvate hydratase [Candidatus Berkelbacteria bacterium]
MIKEIHAQIIHDSRGDETIQATVVTDSGHSGSSAVPAGASKGKYEAKTVPAAVAVENVQKYIAPALIGKDPANQQELDQIMVALDQTEDKSYLGANSILAVSMAISRVAASEKGVELYQHIGSLDHRTGFNLPVPMFNLINGGKHAENNLDIQEFMVIPDRVQGYHNQLSAGKLIFSTLGTLLRGNSAFVPIGDEGGYAPSLDTNEMALDLLVRAIKESGYQPWEEVSLGLDIAASSVAPTFEISPRRYLGLLSDFPILSIEDPFNEEDWDGWSQFRKLMDETNPTSKRIMLVGDDIFATNPSRLSKGLELKAANAILVKLNQIGTVSQTLNVIEMARHAGYIIIISHRSGETLDDYIADFSVGVNAQFIKTGAPNDNHPERMSKYRRLLDIERQLFPNNATTKQA